MAVVMDTMTATDWVRNSVSWMDIRKEYEWKAYLMVVHWDNMTAVEMVLKWAKQSDS